jgi:hypothetical protein
MKIYKITIPEDSLIHGTLKEIHYVDCYSMDFKNERPITIEEVTRLFFKSMPGWVLFLLDLRNWTVKWFGLKGGDAREVLARLDNDPIEPGKPFGIFQVIQRNANEILMGQEDKHLDFRVSIGLDSKAGNEYAAYVATVVQFNHFSGWMYFLPVKPFHKLIIRRMMVILKKKLEVQFLTADSRR